MSCERVSVDPQTLRLPQSRRQGADPLKLHRQIARYGTSISGMPPLVAIRAADGFLLLVDGVTRATRVAKLLPDTMVPVDVIGTYPQPIEHHPTVEEMLP